MAESKEKKLGRISHDLHIIGLINQSRQQQQLRHPIPGDSADDFWEGYQAQEDTLYRGTVRRLFKDTNRGNVLNVGKDAFTLHMPAGMGTFIIDGGIVSKIYLGTFPYVTAITVHRVLGGNITYPNLGSPEFI